jgi:hypothetical protein
MLMHEVIVFLIISTRASVTEYEEVTQHSLDSVSHHVEDVSRNYHIVAQLDFD